MTEEKNTKFCSNCEAEIDIKARICPKCGVEQPIIPEKVSNWWYVLAIFLGIVGGIIAWAVNKDRNPKKAIRFLIVGLVLPVIWIGVSASLVLFSLGGARERAKDAMAKSNMTQIQISAVLIQNEEGSYSKVSCNHSRVAPFCDDIISRIAKEPTIYSTQDAYCAYVKLLSGKYYCVDSGSRTREASVFPGGPGYCDGITFSCP